MDAHSFEILTVCLPLVPSEGHGPSAHCVGGQTQIFSVKRVCLCMFSGYKTKRFI